jgi:hypothetical protein
MNKTRVYAAVLAIALLIVLPSMLIVKPAAATDYPVFADTSYLPKPSTPEFTITLADHSYEVAPTVTSTINPYNNKTTTTTIDGYHVKNVTIDLTIKNQPYPATIEGNTSYMTYFVRTKGHFVQDYVENYQTEPDAIQTSGSDYTVISFPAAGYNAGDEIDFQVKAVLSYNCTYTRGCFPPITESRLVPAAVGNWSQTQTFKIPETLDPSNLAQSSSPDENSWLIPIACIAVVMAVLLVVAVKKKTHLKQAAN